jgi:hypothetical protein
MNTYLKIALVLVSLALGLLALNFPPRPVRRSSHWSSGSTRSDGLRRCNTMQPPTRPQPRRAALLPDAVHREAFGRLRSTVQREYPDGCSSSNRPWPTRPSRRMTKAASSKRSSRTLSRRGGRHCSERQPERAMRVLGRRSASEGPTPWHTSRARPADAHQHQSISSCATVCRMSSSGQSAGTPDYILPRGSGVRGAGPMIANTALLAR